MLIIDKCRSKIVRNRVFDCHLSPNWRQMAIKNTVSSDFFISIRRLLRAFSIAVYPVSDLRVEIIAEDPD